MPIFGLNMRLAYTQVFSNFPHALSSSAQSLPLDRFEVCFKIEEAVPLVIDLFLLKRFSSTFGVLCLI